MLWTGREGLSVLQDSSNTTGDAQDYSQQIWANIAMSKFMRAMLASDGIYYGGASDISGFQNGGTAFPPVALVISSDYASSSLLSTVGPIKTVAISTGHEGTGYSVGDVLTIVGGHNNATLSVTAIDGGAVAGISIISSGTAYSISTEYETASTEGGSGCKIDITALLGNSWFFYSDSAKPISFSTSNAPGMSGVLYAQIKNAPGVSPTAAAGGDGDFILIAKNSIQSVPANSLKLGTGTIVDSKFTKWTPEDNIFVDISPSENKKWTLDIYGGDNIDIYQRQILNISGNNGIKSTLSNTLEQIVISSNLKTDGGIQNTQDEDELDTGLAIKLKSASGLGINSNGLYVSNTTLNFSVKCNTGDDRVFYDKDVMSFMSTSPLKVTTSATDIATISLDLATNGGLTLTSNALSLLLDPSGKLSKDASGLFSQNVSFSISGNSDATGNVVQTPQDGGTITFSGKGGVYTDSRDGTAGKINVGLNLATNSGLQINSDKIKVLVDPSPGVGKQAITLDTNGLSLASATFANTYGWPTTGPHTSGELYRDKSGGLFICDASGTPGTWRQLSIGRTYETLDDELTENYILPNSDDFNGGSKQTGYKIKWISNYDYYNEYANNLIWIWGNTNSCWYTENEFPVQFGKIYISSATIDSNPLQNDIYIGFDSIITSNSLSMSSHKGYWAYAKTMFDGLLINKIVLHANQDVILTCNFVFNEDVFTTGDSLCSISISENDIGISDSSEYCLYTNSGIAPRRLIFADFSGYDNQYEYDSVTAYCRYIVYTPEV